MDAHQLKVAPIELRIFEVYPSGCLFPTGISNREGKGGASGKSGTCCCDISSMMDIREGRAYG
jgi:hypothetical protein